MRDKRKILFFFNSFQIGGAHLQMTYLIRELKHNGFEPIICTHISDEGGLRSNYYELGVRIYNLARKHKFDLSIFRNLKKILEGEKVDIIVLFIPQNFVYYRIVRLFVKREIIQIGLLRSMGFWIGHKSFLLRGIDNFLSSRFIKTSDAVLANSQAIKLQYDQRLNLPPERIKVVYNSSEFVFSINRTREEVRQELNVKASESLVIMVARLDPWKDFDTLFLAAKMVKEKSQNIKFIVCGGGELKEKLEKKVQALGLQATVFLIGEKKNVHEYICAADISVLTTKGEGFSNSIMESMAMAKPVIATDVGGNREIIGDGAKCGFLIKHNDYSTLGNIVITLHKDKQKMYVVGQNAQKRIYELCDKEKNMKLIINQFKRLLVSEAQLV